MSLFTIRMFIPEAPIANPGFENDIDTFGPSYGNRVASERRFRGPWQPHRRASVVPLVSAGDACRDRACA